MTLENTFHVLVVCTGNICRSPQAESLLRARSAEVGWSGLVSVASAGTAAVPGRAPTDQAARETRRYGGEIGDRGSRRLDAGMISRADLVLTMEKAHRADVVRLLPVASRITFTLPEFARLLRGVRDSGEDVSEVRIGPVPDRLRAAVSVASSQRGMAPPVAASMDEVEDPYRHSDDVYARSARRIAAETAEIVHVLRELVRD